MNIEAGCIVRIVSRMKRGVDIRLGVVERVSGNEVHFAPFFNKALCDQHSALPTGYGSLDVSKAGTTPFGVQRVEVINSN